MKIEKAIELIQKEIDNEDIDWDSPLGEAYKLSFEALKEYQNARTGNQVYDGDLLPGETEE